MIIFTSACIHAYAMAMVRYSQRSKSLSASEILTYNDLVFCLEYAKNGQNSTRAYMKAHPNAKPDSARANAVAVLAKASVRAQLDRMYKAAIPDTIETIKADLEEALAMARKAEDHSAIAAISMDKAKLAGLLVDKHADVTQETPNIPQPQLVDELRSRLHDIDAADGASDEKRASRNDLSATENPIRSDRMRAPASGNASASDSSAHAD